MKQLNETFEDEEFNDLVKQKKELNTNWRGFILFLSKFYKDNKK